MSPRLAYPTCSLTSKQRERRVAHSSSSRWRRRRSSSPANFLSFSARSCFIRSRFSWRSFSSSLAFFLLMKPLMMTKSGKNHQPVQHKKTRMDEPLLHCQSKPHLLILLALFLTKAFFSLLLLLELGITLLLKALHLLPLLSLLSLFFFLVLACILDGKKPKRKILCVNTQRLT